MLIGIPKETKDHEFRVGLTPAGVRALADAGHEIRVQTRAGAAVGFGDAQYAAAGARIVDGAADAYACPLVVKVKEPQAEEIPLLTEGQVLFAYLHLSADATLARQLLNLETSVDRLLESLSLCF